MFTPRAIGFVRTPYTDTKSIPKGLGARHDAGGVVEVLSELEAGLTDIDGFSHLFLLWMFDRSQGFDLVDFPRRTEGLQTPRSRKADSNLWYRGEQCRRSRFSQV